MTKQTDGEFLNYVKDAVVDNILNSSSIVGALDKAEITSNNNSNQEQQLGRYKFGIIESEKQNILIRKIMCCYANSFIHNSKRWFQYCKAYRDRHGPNTIVLQFTDFQSFGNDGDKVISCLNKDEVQALHNPVLEKMIDMCDPTHEFVVCFTLSSLEQVKTWFLTLIISKKTNTALIGDYSDEFISFRPSVFQQLEEANEIVLAGTRKCNELDAEMEKIKTKFYDELKGFTNYQNEILSNPSSTTSENKVAIDPDDDIDDKKVVDVAKESGENGEKESFSIESLELIFVTEFLRKKYDNIKNENEKEEKIHKQTNDYHDLKIEYKEKLNRKNEIQKQIEESREKIIELSPKLVSIVFIAPLFRCITLCNYFL